VKQVYTQVKEASSNKGYEAESNAFQHNVSLQKQVQVAMAENNVYTYYCEEI